MVFNADQKKQSLLISIRLYMAVNKSSRENRKKGVHEKRKKGIVTLSLLGLFAHLIEIQSTFCNSGWRTGYKYNR